MVSASLFVAVFLAATMSASATPTDCKFQFESGNHYDLSPIKKTTGSDYVKTIQVGPSIQFIYRMNICGNTMVTCQNEGAPATEALKIPAGETCRVLGRLDNLKVTELKNFNPSKTNNPDGRGVQLTYPGGDVCDPGTRSTRSVTINLVCNTNEDKEEGGTFQEVKKEATCNTVYTFSSAHACPQHGGGSFSKFLLFVFIGTLVYCVVGALVNKFMFHKEVGPELIPNKEFWVAFPGHVKHGCEWTKEKVQGMMGGGDGAPAPGGAGRGPQYNPVRT